MRAIGFWFGEVLRDNALQSHATAYLMSGISHASCIEILQKKITRTSYHTAPFGELPVDNSSASTMITVGSSFFCQCR